MWNKLTILTVVTVLAVFCFATSAFALGVGGLSYNIGPSFSLGAGVSFSQRDVYVIENDDIDDQMVSSRFLVKGNVAPIRYIDIYGLIGTGDLQLDDGDFEGTLGTMWGVGLKPQLFPLTWKSPLNITLDGQYAELRTRDTGGASALHADKQAAGFPYPFGSAAEMLEMGAKSGRSIAQMKAANEQAQMAADELTRGLDRLRDAGQRRPQVLTHVCVVEAGDGDVARHVQTTVGAGRQGARYRKTPGNGPPDGGGSPRSSASIDAFA